MKNTLVFSAIALAAALAIGVFIQAKPEIADLSTSTPSPEAAIVAVDQNLVKYPDSDRYAADIAELNQLLQSEISARQSLERKLAALSQQLASLDGNLQTSTETDSAEEFDSDSDSDVTGSTQVWFNEQALVDNGMNSSRANELKTSFEQLQMERLYLRDQSIRENWDRAKFREAMQTLTDKEDEIKNQLSESSYDAYLYASGQPNRVAVTDVLASSQAGMAGIISGDQIVRYNNQRIYNGFDLREATAGGNISDMVALEVERDGKTMQFYLARGPLGIRMNSVSIAPGS